MSLKITKQHKVHFSVSLMHVFFIQEGQPCTSIDFSQHYYIMDFFPFKTKYNNDLYSKTVFITFRADRVCGCGCPCIVMNVSVTALRSVCVFADVDEHLCVTFFNNVLPDWALGTAISLTLPKSHNADPLGGRISHQLVAESPRAKSREKRNHDGCNKETGLG